VWVEATASRFAKACVKALRTPFNKHGKVFAKPRSPHEYDRWQVT
jgi:hypothetical protein